MVRTGALSERQARLMIRQRHANARSATRHYACGRQRKERLRREPSETRRVIEAYHHPEASPRLP